MGTGRLLTSEAEVPTEGLPAQTSPNVMKVWKTKSWVEVQREINTNVCSDLFALHCPPHLNTASQSLVDKDDGVTANVMKFRKRGAFQDYDHHIRRGFLTNLHSQPSISSLPSCIIIYF